MYILERKIKYVKTQLKGWNVNAFQNIFGEYKDLEYNCDIGKIQKEGLLAEILWKYYH